MLFSAKASQQLLRSSASLAVRSVQKQQYAATRSMTILSKQSAEEYKKQNYSSRMKETGRPVSPHVTIYAFPAVALSSITNRVTGVCLSLGAAGLGLVEIVGGSGMSATLMSDIGSMGPLVSMPAKFGVAFTGTYHYLGALRHLSWDEKPELLVNEDVYKSSLVLFGASTVISAGIALM
mmetsp:Transcript_15438/g.21505  ORF Transcript_15438/g.21505 Transcript_15438/m.21505 type:complete len:179 (-) Transcript_15438:173-709(-)